MRNAGLDEAQAGIKISGRNIKNLRYADDTTLMEESEEELKNLLMKVKEESEKAGLSLTFRKLRSWHLIPLLHGNYMGKQWKLCQTLIWGSPKSLQMLTASLKLKDSFRGRKVMTNLDIILKCRDITLPTKVHPIKAMIFPVVLYGCESWTVKKAEYRRIDAFELWCWRRLFRVP